MSTPSEIVIGASEIRIPLNKDGVGQVRVAADRLPPLPEGTDRQWLWLEYSRGFFAAFVRGDGLVDLVGPFCKAPATGGAAQ